MALNRNESRRGQGMTENILIVALVAIGTMGVVTVFGDNLRNVFGASSSSLAGGDSANGGSAVGPGMTKKNVKTFNQGSNGESSQGGGSGGPESLSAPR